MVKTKKGNVTLKTKNKTIELKGNKKIIKKAKIVEKIKAKISSAKYN